MNASSPSWVDYLPGIGNAFVAASLLTIPPLVAAALALRRQAVGANPRDLTIAAYLASGFAACAGVLHVLHSIRAWWESPVVLGAWSVLTAAAAVATAFRVPGVARLAGEARTRSEYDLERARFVAAFEASSIGFAIVGLDGRWVRVNRALEAILQRSESELVGMTYQELTHPDDLEKDEENVRRLLDSGPAPPRYSMRKRYLLPGGTYLPARLTVAVVRDPSTSAPMYFVSQIEDLSAVEAAMAEKDRANSYLDRQLHALEAEVRQLTTAIETSQDSRIAEALEGLDSAVARLRSGGPIDEN